MICFKGLSIFFKRLWFIGKFNSFFKNSILLLVLVSFIKLKGVKLNCFFFVIIIIFMYLLLLFFLIFIILFIEGLKLFV